MPLASGSKCATPASPTECRSLADDGIVHTSKCIYGTQSLEWHLEAHLLWQELPKTVEAVKTSDGSSKLLPDAAIELQGLRMDIEAQKKAQPSKGNLALQLFSAAFYGTMAIAMNFVNKAALQNFPLSNVLLLNQMLLALLVLPTLKGFGYLSYPAISWQRATGVLGVTILYVTNVAFSLMSLSTLNIVFYSTLKRLTPMLVLVIKACMSKRLPPRAVSLSVGLVVGGCIIAGAGDFAFDAKGYFFALSSCCLQASYLLLVEYNGEAKNVGTSELMVYNALWSIPCLMLVIYITGDAAKLAPAVDASMESLGLYGFASMLLGCGIFGMLLNFSQFLCTMNNSALTTTVVGVMKGVAATALGFVFFGGVKTGAMNLTGIGMNTAGGVWYTVAKYQQRAAASSAKSRDVE